MGKFKAIYDVSDGYVGKSRPKYFTIAEGELDNDMTEDELRELFQQSMQNNFEQDITPYQQNEDEFVEWAKNILAKDK